MSDQHLHDDIGCMEAINALYAYLDGELGDGISVAQVEAHLQHCRSCFSRLEIERALTVRLQQNEEGRAPAGVRRRLRKLLDEL